MRQRWCRSTASLRAPTTTAHFFAMAPPRAAHRQSRQKVTQSDPGAVEIGSERDRCGVGPGLCNAGPDVCGVGPGLCGARPALCGVGEQTMGQTFGLVFRDPYVLDFLGLKDTYGETDLEAAILREIEAFILEIGVGFCFVERQKRMQIDGRDYTRIKTSECAMCRPA